MYNLLYLKEKDLNMSKEFNEEETKAKLYCNKNYYDED